MKLADLVHKTTWKSRPANLGIVVGFDEECDPEIEWIIPYIENCETTYEYREELIVIEDKNEI